MTSPDDALARARAEAQAQRAAGAYPEPEAQGAPATPGVTNAKLLEWAVISPELHDVRSTRRYGAPLTAFKRILVRLLAQYHSELTAQQTRFNLNLLARMRALEERVEELERERRA